MGNPFYIPRENPMMDIAKLGLQLYGLKQQGDIAADANRLRQDELRMKGMNEAADQVLKAEEIGTRNRQVGAMERQNQISEMKLNPREKNWGLGDWTLMKNRMRSAGFDPDKIEFLDELKAVAMDNNVNRGALAEQMAASWEDGTKTKFTTSLAESIDAILKKDPNADVTKQVEILNAIEQTPADKVMQTFFPDIVQHDQEQAAKQRQGQPLTVDQKIVSIMDKFDKGEITEQHATTLINMAKGIQPKGPEDLEKTVGPDGRPVLTPKSKAAGMTPYLAPQSEVVTWSKPYKDEAGNMVQKSNRGEIKTIDKADKPEKGPSATEQRMTAKDVADAEAKILSNKSSDIARGEVDVFNQYAEKPYAYSWKKTSTLGFDTGGEWDKVQLPKNSKGKQITAKDVYEYASRTGRTYEDVLMEVLNAAKGKK